MDSAICADMSAAILVQNGSAVDAAITGMLCTGVVYAESSGIGGGGFMVVRLANGSVYALNFREKAPAAATEDMSTASRVREEEERRVLLLKVLFVFILFVFRVCCP